MANTTGTTLDRGSPARSWARIRVAPRHVVAAVVLVVVGALGACGGPSATPGNTPQPNATAPAIGTQTQINALTPAQMTELCDWYATLAGGYGFAACEGGTAPRASPSQADCVINALATAPPCIATLDMWEPCAKALASADPCDELAIAGAQASTECSTYFGDNGDCTAIE
jgi:hypothetical protein